MRRFILVPIAIACVCVSCSDEPAGEEADSSSDQSTAGGETTEASEGPGPATDGSEDVGVVETKSDSGDEPCTCEALAEKLTALELKVEALEQRSPGLGAYDAEGNYLGQVSGRTSDVRLDVKAFHPEFLFPLHVDEDGSVSVKEVTFTSSDCSGTPYLVGDNPVVGGDYDGNLYVPAQGQSGEFQLLKSQLKSDEAGCWPMPFPDEGYAVWRAEKVVSPPPFPYPILGPISIK